MNAQPLVSIIIPTYNRASLIAETLDSIQQQTYENWECIVVDDGSTDTTSQVMQRYMQNDGRIQFYYRPITLIKGGNSCRNFGFTKIKGEFVQWFDSDDLMVKNALEEKIALIDSKIDAVFSGFKTFEKTSKNIKATYNCKKTEDILESYLLGDLVFNIPSLMYRREFVKNIKFSETLTRAQDLDFVYKCISQKKANITQVTKAHCLVRLHVNTITSQFSNLKKEDLTSEILVREAIFFDAMKLEKRLRLYPTQRYFNSLKNALKAKQFQLFNNVLFKNNQLSMMFKLKLYVISVFYKLTGKGLTRYNEVVNGHFL
ncbi:glycosyl transferase [Patiriisocius marinistellae]|uniref:Glycosyl transferase n=1 Tax=Patiriisocius marinistellae TaxID=2494560 RepID=A0A5J4FZY0_9FLAO|nr:glycosyltransferase family 2 protein [Patiriisocius marinistellae]GEQ86812.1 glycosyl transferase [Patiriisocius marinistellae]